MRGYPYFSLWIPIALVKIYFFPREPYLVQKPLYLVGTVLNCQVASKARLPLAEEERYKVQICADPCLDVLRQ